MESYLSEGTSTVVYKITYGGKLPIYIKGTLTSMLQDDSDHYTRTLYRRVIRNQIDQHTVRMLHAVRLAV